MNQIIKIEYKGKSYSVSVYGSGSESYGICPICTPTRKSEHQNEKKLAVNFEKLNSPWRCNHCNAAGYLIKDHEYRSRSIKPLKEYHAGEKPSEGMISYYQNKRKISKETLDHFGIAVTRISIRDKKSGKMINRRCISYKYFYKGQVIRIKYKDQEKNFSSTKNSESIFYNIDSIQDSKIIYITEGEDDAMAMYEAGFHAVISVPNGVVITKKEKEMFDKTGKLQVLNQINLEYLDRNIDDLNHVEKFIICTDDDAAGIKLREELARRLEKHKCKYVQFGTFEKPDGTKCKDANDVLIHHDIEGLKSCIKEAKDFPIDDVVSIDDVWDQMITEFNHGKVKGKSIGFKSLDPHFTLREGHLVVINGFYNNGKTSFVFMIVLVTAIRYNWKWAIYSPENYPVSDAYDTLVEMLVGNTSDIAWNDRMSFEDYKVAAKEFLSKYVYFIDREEGYTPNELRTVYKRMIHRYGIKGVITDPWNSLTEDLKGNENIVRYLTRELSQEVRFTTHNKLVRIICVHPPTPEKNSEKVYKAPDAFDIDGGAIWSKKAYEILSVHLQDKDDLSNTNTEVYVWKVKYQKLVGIPTNRNPVILEFQRRSGRYSERIDDNLVCPLDDIFKEFKKKLFGKIEGF